MRKFAKHEFDIFVKCHINTTFQTEFSIAWSMFQILFLKEFDILSNLWVYTKSPFNL